MTKILFLIPSLKIAGAEKICTDICDFINQEEFEVHLISLTDEVPLYNDLENKDNVNLYTCGNINRRRGLPWISMNSLFQFYTYVKNIKPDIVHSHLWGRFCLFHYVFLLVRNIKTFIATIHTSGIHYSSRKLVDRLFKFIENASYRLLKFNLVSISEDVGQMIESELYATSTTRIENGVRKNIETPEKKKKDLINQLSIKVNHPILIHVGRASNEKRQIDLIRAIPYLKKTLPRLKLLLAGRENEEKFSEVVNELKLNGEVKFLGVRTDVTDLLNVSDIGVFPSLFEGFGLVLIEMMMAGLPVVATDIPTTREITDSGKGAVLVSTKSPKQIADAVLRIVRDETLKRKVSDRGKEIAEKRYSVDAMVRKYEQLYKKLV